MEQTLMFEPDTSSNWKELKTTPFIMVLDDDPFFRSVVSGALIAEGYEVLSLSHPATALAMAQQSEPDLVLFDGAMPQMSGLHFFELLRNDGYTGKGVLLSASAKHVLESPMRWEIQEQLAINNILNKPIDSEDLVNIITELLPFGQEQLSHGGLVEPSLYGFQFMQSLRDKENEASLHDGVTKRVYPATPTHGIRSQQPRRNKRPSAAIKTVSQQKTRTPTAALATLSGHPLPPGHERPQQDKDPVTQALSFSAFKNVLDDHLTQPIPTTSTLLFLKVSAKTCNETKKLLKSKQYMRILAMRLRGVLPKGTPFGHLSDQTFGVFIPRVLSTPHVEEIITNLQERLDIPLQTPEGPIHTYLDVGVSFAPEDGKTSAVLIRNANSNLTLAVKKRKSTLS